LSFLAVSRRCAYLALLAIGKRPFGDWEWMFGDSVATIADLNRAPQHNQVVTIYGHYHGLRDGRRRSLLYGAATAAPIC